MLFRQLLNHRAVECRLSVRLSWCTKRGIGSEVNPLSVAVLLQLPLLPVGVELNLHVSNWESQQLGDSSGGPSDSTEQITCQSSAGLCGPVPAALATEAQKGGVISTESRRLRPRQ